MSRVKAASGRNKVPPTYTGVPEYASPTGSGRESVEIYDNGEASPPDTDAIYAVAERDDTVSGSAAASQHQPPQLDSDTAAAAADDMIYEIAEHDDAVYGDASIFQPPDNPDEGEGAEDMVYDNGEAGALPPTMAPSTSPSPLPSSSPSPSLSPSPSPSPSPGGRVITLPGAVLRSKVDGAGVRDSAAFVPPSWRGAQSPVTRRRAPQAQNLPLNLTGVRGLDAVSQTNSVAGVLGSDDVYASVDEVPLNATIQRPPAVPTTKRPNNRRGGANDKAKTVKKKKRPPALVPPTPPSGARQTRQLPTVTPSPGEVVYSAGIGGGDELYADAEETGASPAPDARQTGDIYAMAIPTKNRNPPQQGEVVYSAGIDAGGGGGGGGDELYTSKKSGATAAADDAVYAVSTKTLGRRTKQPDRP